MFQMCAHIKLFKLLEDKIQTKCRKFNYLTLPMLLKTVIHIYTRCKYMVKKKD